MTTDSLWMDEINRRTWGEPATVDWFSNLEGWTDPGEKAAVERVAAGVRGAPILDLGVGGGRTVPLLRALSRDYVAIDYTPELVAACKLKYPDVNVTQGDARDLCRFPAGAFKLVVFSFNGIDAVGHADRAQILEAVYRVLCPGGIFLFSAHNLDGPGHGERLDLGVYGTRNPFKLAVRVLRAAARAGRTIRNHARYSKLGFDGEGYSIKNAAAHDHGIVIHYTSLAAQLAALGRAGFLPDTPVYGNQSGQPLRPGDDVRGAWWFHFLAKK